jgi:hypothetical protein
MASRRRHPRGVKNIQGFCNGDEKDSLTVVAALAAARIKLPLTLIATGKTHIVEENHFGDIGHHCIDHSGSGWTTADTFQRWLAWLGSVYDDGDPLWPVLDRYSVHRRCIPCAGVGGCQFSSSE